MTRVYNTQDTSNSRLANSPFMVLRRTMDKRNVLFRRVAGLLRMDVNQVTKEVASIAPFLIPFLKMACVYFVLWLPEDQPCISSAFVKALPILSLIWFVCLQGISCSRDPSHSYNLKILFGLVMSCCGDVSLIWQNNDEVFFMLGLACFLIAHVCYTLAFDFTPFGVKECVIMSLLAVTMFSILLPYLSGVMLYAVFVYGLILWLMSWRSLARFSLKWDIPWRKIFAACGAILFVLSDSILAVNKFMMRVPWERQLIMTTYYAAQLCLSLSVVNSRLYRSKEEISCVPTNQKLPSH